MKGETREDFALTTPDYWDDAKAHLSKVDSVLGEVIARYPGELMQTRGDAFYTLLRSIVGQQISVKAADAVWGRTEAAMQKVTPEHLLALEDEALRACGLSRQKIAYSRNIALHFQQKHINEAYFATLSDAEVIADLTEIKGVGRWTAEMFLMFHLLRADILPLDDIGLLKGIEVAYGWPERLKKADYAELAEKWAPYRTVATWYFWRLLDPVPVEY